MRAAALLVLLATDAAVRPSLRRASEIATTLEELSNEVDELSVEMEAHALVPEPLALERRERTERTTVQAPVGREARVVKLKARAGKYRVNNVIRYRYLAGTHCRRPRLPLPPPAYRTLSDAARRYRSNGARLSDRRRGDVGRHHHRQGLARFHGY